MNRHKHVTRKCADRDAAHKLALIFIARGGIVLMGAELPEGGFGWTGSILVDDTAENISGSFGCGRCSRTGRFITYVENGKPRGPGGHCFRCGGKGYHTQTDRKRNLYHDMHAFCDAA